MRKFEEIKDTSSCLNRAHSEEMLFTLLTRDAAAPATIRIWIELRVALGLNKVGDKQLIEAYKVAAIMELERRNNNPIHTYKDGTPG